VQQAGDFTTTIDDAIKLGVSIAGVRDELVLCVTPIQNGLDAFVSIDFKELT